MVTGCQTTSVQPCCRGEIAARLPERKHSGSDMLPPYAEVHSPEMLHSSSLGAFTLVRRALDGFLSRHVLFDLPASLAALYFLNSCVQSLPLTANTGFLNLDLHMPQSTQSVYYAVSFMPWSLKPVFGFVADRFPIAGSHFRP